MLGVNLFLFGFGTTFASSNRDASFNRARNVLRCC